MNLGILLTLWLVVGFSSPIWIIRKTNWKNFLKTPNRNDLKNESKFYFRQSQFATNSSTLFNSWRNGNVITAFSLRYLLSIFSYCGLWFWTWLDLAIEVRAKYVFHCLRRSCKGETRALIDVKTLNDFQFFFDNALNVNLYFFRFHSHPSMYADPDFSESRIGWVKMILLEGKNRSLIQLRCYHPLLNQKWSL